MPQSYGFIFKPARDSCEKLQKKLEIAFFYVTRQGAICHDEQVAYRLLFFSFYPSHPSRFPILKS